MKSKRSLKFLITIFTVLIVLLGCSSKPSLDLVSSTVEIRNDEESLGSYGISSGEEEPVMLVPIALSYDFVLKNTGKKTLGGMEKPNAQEFDFDDGIKIYIEPNKKLKEISEEIMGYDIYDKDENKLGVGRTSSPVIKPNQDGEYTFNFDLGVLEEQPDIQIAPSSEQIKRLKKHAMDATLVVFVEDVEIERFDLSNKN